MVIIRLKRMGNKHRPSYRIVVSDSRNRSVGMYLNVVGTYNPRKDPPEIHLDMEKIEEWQSKGAAVSDTVASLIRRYKDETAH